MSTTLLYRVFGVRDHLYEKTEYSAGRVTFSLSDRQEPRCCPECGSPRIQLRGGKMREWQTVPIGSRQAFLRCLVRRVSCHDCERTLQVAPSFAVPQHSYSRAFERYALELRQCMTTRDVAEHLGVTDWKVKDIEKRYLGKKFGKPPLKDLRLLAIDEISIGKGHRYLTVVLDLESGAIVFVGEGKDVDALVPFWRRLKRARARIEAVAIDMSQAYINAVQNNLPNAQIVFDRFHIVKLFNDKLSTLRRDLHRQATDHFKKKVLKGTRWLLLKNPENLNTEKGEDQRLEDALRLNQPLATAYYLKEELHLFWEQDSAWAAETFLEDWCARARASGIRILQTLANTLQAHRYGILAWYDYPISTGPLEGTNNKIKTLNRQAYGFRDQEYFRLKLYALHLTRYELVG